MSNEKDAKSEQDVNNAKDEPDKQSAKDETGEQDATDVKDGQDEQNTEGEQNETDVKNARNEMKVKDETKVKRQKGSRRDAYRVQLPYDFNAMFPYIMKRRCDSVIFFSESIDVENVLRYVEAKKTTDEKVSFFQVILLAIVKLLRERPELNRYAKGRRLYQRKNIVLNFIAKREFSDTASETNVTVRIEPEDRYETILDKITGGIRVAKAGEEKDDDKTISTLMRLPRFLLMLLFKFLDFTDFYGIMPKSLESIDPIRCSVFVANLGSVGIDAPFHHLFEWGTNSLFLTIGCIKKTPFVEEDGTIVAKTMVDMKVSLDERISDGFYYARSLDMFKQFLQDPESLENL